MLSTIRHWSLVAGAPTERPDADIRLHSERQFAFLDSCHRSLRNQTLQDWEWVVVQHGDVRMWRPQGRDEHVVVLRDEAVQGVAAAKRMACQQATGDLLVVLHHSDELGTTCLDRVAATFAEREDAGFVYSDSAQIHDDGKRSDARLEPSEGWRFSGAEVNERLVLRRHAFEPSPHNVASIVYAPGNVRAFRRSTYEAAGGYDPARTILDDEDLMCRMFEVAPFLHIPECLYLERILDSRSSAEIVANRRIRTDTVELYDTYVQRLALAWAEREGLAYLDLGAAHNKPAGYLGVDQYPGEGVDIVADVTKGIDLPDNSVGVIRAVDFLEHIPDKIAIFTNCTVSSPTGGCCCRSPRAPTAAAPSRTPPTSRSTTRTASGTSPTAATPTSSPR